VETGVEGKSVRLSTPVVRPPLASKTPLYLLSLVLVGVVPRRPQSRAARRARTVLPPAPVPGHAPRRATHTAERSRPFPNYISGPAAMLRPRSHCRICPYGRIAQCGNRRRFRMSRGPSTRPPPWAAPAGHQPPHMGDSPPHPAGDPPSRPRGRARHTPNTAPAGGGGFFFGFRPGLYSSSTGHVRWSGPTVLLRDKRDQEDRPLFPVGRARLFVPTPPCQISSECEGKHISASAGWWTCALTRGFHWPGNSFTGGVSGSARRLVEWWSPRACTGRIPDNVAPAVTRAHGDSVPVIHLGTSGRRSFVYGSSTNHPPWPHPLRTRMCLVPRSVNELLPPMVFSLPPASVRRLSVTFVLAPLYHGRGTSTGDTLLLSFFFARADNLLFSPLCS